MGVFATWKARLFVAIPMLAGLYQFGCDQFGWPKLPVLLGITTEIVPWWGWLLIAQAGFVFALFEYVRRNALINDPGEVFSSTEPDTDASSHTNIDHLGRRITATQNIIEPVLAEIPILRDALKGLQADETKREQLFVELSRVTHWYVYGSQLLSRVTPESHLNGALRVDDFEIEELEHKLLDMRFKFNRERLNPRFFAETPAPGEQILNGPGNAGNLANYRMSFGHLHNIVRQFETCMAEIWMEIAMDKELAVQRFEALLGAMAKGDAATPDR